MSGKAHLPLETPATTSICYVITHNKTNIRKKEVSLKIKFHVTHISPLNERIVSGVGQSAECMSTPLSQLHSIIAFLLSQVSLPAITLNLAQFKFNFLILFTKLHF
jgi:hypothetical protein